MCFHIFVQFLVICDNDCKILQVFSKLYVFFYPITVMLFCLNPILTCFYLG